MAKTKEEMRKYKREWAAKKRSRLTPEEKERIKKYNAKWVELNPEYHKEHRKTYQEKYKSRKRGLRKTPKYHEAANIRQRHRNRTDPQFMMKRRLRARMYQALKKSNATKAAKTFDLLGCSVNELKIHIEKQFVGQMSWQNYGDWHLDHIKPCCAFNLLNPVQQRECFHYTNLQPLWGKENQSKGGRL